MTTKKTTPRTPRTRKPRTVDIEAPVATAEAPAAAIAPTTNPTPTTSGLRAALLNTQAVRALASANGPTTPAQPVEVVTPAPTPEPTPAAAPSLAITVDATTTPTPTVTGTPTTTPAATDAPTPSAPKGALTVACPKCGAPAGTPCTATTGPKNARVTHVAKYPHGDRVAAAKVTTKASRKRRTTSTAKAKPAATASAPKPAKVSRSVSTSVSALIEAMRADTRGECVAALATHTATARALLVQLSASVEDRAGNALPTWADVGDAARLCTVLRALVTATTGKEPVA